MRNSPALPRKILALVLTATAMYSYGLDRKFPTLNQIPSERRVINVKEHGVIGNGVASDRAALQTLITANVGSNRYLYFPNGTYRIDNTLYWTKADGKKDCGLTLIGESVAGTRIKLDDNLPSFNEVGAEKSMLMFYSQTNSAGFDNVIDPANPSRNNGLGNSAFRNAIQNMTIDIGAGNQNAIAIDFMCNNIGRVQDVVITSSDPLKKGKCGLELTRGSPGPMLIKNVTISGFDFGIRVAGKIASVTMEDVQLNNQKVLGIQNYENTLSIRKLTSVNAVPVIKNVKGSGSHPYEGMVSLIDCLFTGGSASAIAIENEGSLFIRNLAATGYFASIRDRGVVVPGKNHLEFTTVWKSFHQSNQSRFSLFPSPLSSLNLPIAQTPEYFDTEFNNWAVVLGDQDPNVDDCDAIRTAMNSGKSTVFFPIGTYTCGETIRVQGNVRHILGDGAILGVHDFKESGNRKPFFDITDLNGSLLIENLDFSENDYRNDPDPNPGLVYIRHSSPKTLTLSGVRFKGRQNNATVYESTLGAGNLFIEDVICHASTTWSFSPGQYIWARQFNPEGGGLKMDNNGANLWILGLKTENPGSICKTRNGGKTEVLGGMLVPVNTLDPLEPAFIIEDASVSLTYAANNPQSHKYPHAWYEIQVQEKKNGVTQNLFVNAVTSNTGTRDMQLPLYVSKAGWSDPLSISAIEPNIVKPAGSPVYRLKFTYLQGNGTRTCSLQSLSAKSLVQTQKALLEALKLGKTIRVNSNHGDEASSIVICKDASNCPKPEN